MTHPGIRVLCLDTCITWRIHGQCVQCGTVRRARAFQVSLVPRHLLVKRIRVLFSLGLCTRAAMVVCTTKGREGRAGAPPRARQGFNEHSSAFGAPAHKLFHPLRSGTVYCPRPPAPARAAAGRPCRTARLIYVQYHAKLTQATHTTQKVDALFTVLTRPSHIKSTPFLVSAMFRPP